MTRGSGLSGIDDVVDVEVGGCRNGAEIAIGTSENFGGKCLCLAQGHAGLRTQYIAVEVSQTRLSAGLKTGGQDRYLL